MKKNIYKEKKVKLIYTLGFKVFIIGLFSIITVLLLSVISINCIKRNNENYNLTKNINDVTIYQQKNNALRTSYLENLDNEYMKDISKNFVTMSDIVSNSFNIADDTQAKYLNELLDILNQTNQNVNNLINKNDERGLNTEIGYYKDLENLNIQIQEELKNLGAEHTWIDLFFDDSSNFSSKTVKVDNKRYIKFTYKQPLPDKGDRQAFMVRVGKTAVNYDGKIYINDINFINNNENKLLNLENTFDYMKDGSYGSALKSMELKKFNKDLSIEAVCKFTESNNCWEEATFKLDISDINLKDYTDVKYDVYFDAKEFESMNLGAVIDTRYDFTEDEKNLVDLINKYNVNIIQGNKEQSNKLYNQIIEILNSFNENILNATGNDNPYTNLKSLYENKIKLIETINNIDNDILTLTNKNKDLDDKLTEEIEVVKSNIEKEMVSSRDNIINTIFILSIVCIVIVLAFTIIISLSMEYNVKQFSKALYKMSKGDLNTRIKVKTKDEIGLFSRLLNEFVDQLALILKSVQEMSSIVENKNKLLAEIIKQIINGVENNNNAMVKHGMLQLKEMFNSIENSVNTQSEGTKQSLENLNEILQINRSSLDEILNTKDISDKALKKSLNGQDEILNLSQMIEKINQSVIASNTSINFLVEDAKNIEILLESIQNLASQTNLLSINASIEAARAGENGKGFSVVASEVKNLSDSTSEEAYKIDKFINEINNKIESVQKANEQVVSDVSNTLEKINFIKEIVTDMTQATQLNASCVEKIANQIDLQKESTEEIFEAINDISNNSQIIQEKSIYTTDITNNISNILIDYMKDINELIDYSEKLSVDLNFFKIK